VETWQIVAAMLLSVGGLLTPIVLAARSRDAALLTMITNAKEDMARQVKAGVDPLHERINRVRDEYVRRDDLEGHLVRLDNRFDKMEDNIRRGQESVERKFDELTKMLRGGK
jgi:uncharacterized membrane protein